MTAELQNNRRLLIVDDSKILRLRIKELATTAGWQIVGEAGDGQTAVELYRQLQPNLVTMDIVMPIMDEALRHIRQLDPKSRVCMVSAVNQTEKLTECIRLGAIDFIVKPFDKAILLGLFEKQGRVQ
jgi:two-component system, chemotaxis family, chemotaxis protein CheY